MRVGTKMRKTRGPLMNLGTLQGPDMSSQMMAFGQGMVSQMAAMQDQITRLTSSGSSSSAVSGLASRLALLDVPPAQRIAAQPPFHLQLTAPSPPAEAEMALSEELLSPPPAAPAAPLAPLTVAKKAVLALTVPEATRELQRAMGAKRAAEDDTAEEPATSAKGKAKGKAKSKGKAKAKGKAIAAKVDISHERSRKQLLCRSGVAEHSSKTFKYGDSKNSLKGNETTENEALKLAKAFNRKRKDDNH
jgi:hypothetical protein